MTFLSKIRQTVNALTQPIEPIDLSLSLEEQAAGECQSSPQAADLQYCRAMQQTSSANRLAKCWRKLEETMALVPGGNAWMTPIISLEPGYGPSDATPTRVEPLYIDRFPVTNAQFEQFVQDDGYNREEFWSAEMLSYLLHFVDRSGTPAPKYWEKGKPPVAKRNHPVVGVSWYEAQAFATWAGKQLASPAQWQQSACWFSTKDGPQGTQYPWGTVFNPERANTWHSGLDDTLPVDAYPDSATPNGVYQLIGNVWEWTSELLGLAPEETGHRLVIQHPMAEVRGGAFDTYFETQATCQFRTGQRLVYRGPNVGFRCCVPVELLPAQPDPSAFMLEPPV